MPSTEPVVTVEIRLSECTKLRSTRLAAVGPLHCSPRTILLAAPALLLSEWTTFWESVLASELLFPDIMPHVATTLAALELLTRLRTRFPVAETLVNAV